MDNSQAMEHVFSVYSLVLHKIKARRTKWAKEGRKERSKEEKGKESILACCNKDMKQNSQAWIIGSIWSVENVNSLNWCQCLQAQKPSGISHSMVPWGRKSQSVISFFGGRPLLLIDLAGYKLLPVWGPGQISMGSSSGKPGSRTSVSSLAHIPGFLSLKDKKLALGFSKGTRGSSLGGVTWAMVTLFCWQINPILFDAVSTLASNAFFQIEVIYQKRKQEDISHCRFLL